MKTSILALLADDAECLQAIFDAMPGNAVFVKTDAPVFTMLAATPNYLAQTGRPKESIIGKGTFEAFPGNDTDTTDTGQRHLRASYQHVLAHKEPHYLPVQRYDLKAEDGSFAEHYWRASNSPVFGPSGEVAYIIHSAEDITLEINAREMEERIKGLEQAYGLFMQAPFAIHIFTGPDLIIDLANPPTLELWGKTEDVTGRRFLDVLPELKGQGYDKMMKEVMQSGKPKLFYEVPLSLNRPGKDPVGYFNFIYQPYYKDGSSKAESVLIIAHEVTEQVAAKRRMEESEARFRNLIEEAPVATCLFVGTDLVMEIVNQRMLEILGKGPHLQGMKFTDAVPEVATQPFRELLRQVLRSGETYTGLAVKAELFRDGEWGTYYFDSTYKAIRNAAGELYAVLGMAIDVTERVKAREALETLQREHQLSLEAQVQQRTKELAEANETLYDINKELQRSNANLEEFAHAASHDLKEPLRKITFFTNLLKEQLGDHLRETEARSFHRIENATERMRTLIDDLLLYSHVTQRPHEMEGVDLAVKVQRVLEDLELDIHEKSADIHIEQLPVVRGYRRQLQQLFQNLISNALKYSKAGVPPKIDITAEMHEDEGRRYHLIKVRDNGIGIDKKFTDKIFEMFARLHGKGEYSGTGVGLSIVKKVIQNHHGFIKVESAPGKGSTFEIYLPVKFE